MSGSFLKIATKWSKLGAISDIIAGSAGLEGIDDRNSIPLCHGSNCAGMRCGVRFVHGDQVMRCTCSNISPLMRSMRYRSRGWTFARALAQAKKEVVDKECPVHGE